MINENETEMPEKIWAYSKDNEDNSRGIWDTRTPYTGSKDVLYVRDDTIPKTTIIRQRADGYWEALSDGSDAFAVYDERIEEDYMSEHPDHDGEVKEAWVAVPRGQWSGIHQDTNLDEAVEHLEEMGYQVFVIPKQPSRAEIVHAFVDEVLSIRGYFSSDPNAPRQPTIIDHMRNVLKEWKDAEK